MPNFSGCTKLTDWLTELLVSLRENAEVKPRYSLHRTRKLSLKKVTTRIEFFFISLDNNNNNNNKKLRRHCSSVGRASDRHVADAGSIPGTASFCFFFSLRVNFQCRLSYSVCTSCTNICAHVKDTVVHVRVRWVTETSKYSACT